VESEFAALERRIQQGALHSPCRSFVLLTFNIVQSSEDFHAAILVSCSTSALQAAIKAVIIRRPFAVS